MEEEKTVREITILSLSEDIHRRLNDLQDALDKRFSRNPMLKGEGASERPEISNVLDEIIQRLKDDRKHLDSIIGFILSEVLPKIS